MLTLDSKQVKELEEVIHEMPFKYAFHLLNILRKFAKENSEKEQNQSEVKNITTMNTV